MAIHLLRGHDSGQRRQQGARQLAIQSKDISASYLQRKLQIGFPRAARIMDKLKEEGYGKEKGAEKSEG